VERFIDKHQAQITGTISCFDRILFKGHLPLGRPEAMEQFIARQGTLIKDFGAFVTRQSEKVKRHAQATARRAGRPFIHPRRTVFLRTASQAHCDSETFARAAQASGREVLTSRGACPLDFLGRTKAALKNDLNEFDGAAGLSRSGRRANDHEPAGQFVIDHLEGSIIPLSVGGCTNDRSCPFGGAGNEVDDGPSARQRSPSPGVRRGDPECPNPNGEHPGRNDRNRL